MPEPTANELESVYRGNLVKDDGTLGEIGEALADALPPSAESGSVEVVTYDFADLTGVHAGVTDVVATPFKAVKMLDRVFLQGHWFAAAGNSLGGNTPHFTLPADARPAGAGQIELLAYMLNWDTSADLALPVYIWGAAASGGKAGQVFTNSDTYSSAWSVRISVEGLNYSTV